MFRVKYLNCILWISARPLTQNFPNSIAVPATTIDDVIQQLTAIVEWSKQNNSRMGYFAALYRKVTIQVKKGIQENYFDNGPRMERLDVIFANRHIQTCYQYQTGQTPTQSWVRAFNATPTLVAYCGAAWSFAEKLSPLNEQQRQAAIVEKDEIIALFSLVISHPGVRGAIIMGLDPFGRAWRYARTYRDIGVVDMSNFSNMHYAAKDNLCELLL